MCAAALLRRCSLLGRSAASAARLPLRSSPPSAFSTPPGVCLPALLLLPLIVASGAPTAFISSRSSPATRRGNSTRPLPESLAEPYDPNDAMAWECSGFSNRELVENLRKGHIIKTQRVYDAMMAVDRALFVPDGQQIPALAYQDSPQSIGSGATISAPHMHAMCLELLADRLKPGHNALDVGSGSGYLVAALAEMVAPKGHTGGGAASTSAAGAPDERKTPAASASGAGSSITPSVFGIEHIGALVEASKRSLAAWDPHYEQRIHVVHGDGRLGLPGSLYHAIHVGAAAASIPQQLIDQLAPGGRLVIPVGPAGGDQHLDAIDKDEHGKITRTRVTGVRYVPLTSEKSQMQGAGF